jgi:hypothetical protein
MSACTKCGEHGYTMPLHGERGGPQFCFMCAGAWHAEHGYVVDGGAWWEHCQEAIAKFKQTTAKQNNAGAGLTSRHADTVS